MNVPKVAVYWDFENLHASLFNQSYGHEANKQYVHQKQERLLNIPVLMEYIFSLGDVVINRAYNNWQSFAAYRDDLLLYAIDLIQLYPKGMYAKNGADIRLALDALEDATYHPHITHVVILGGDSDYIALAQKLKKLGKYVIGVGVKASTNPYWIRSCNEFKLYEMLISKAPHLVEPVVPPAQPAAGRAGNDRVLTAAKEVLVRAVQHLMAEEDTDEVLKAKVRPMMNRLEPEFDPGNYGFATFNAFLAACGDVIQSRKGDYDMMISLLERPERGTQLLQHRDTGQAQVVQPLPTVRLGQTNGENQVDAVYLLTWSVKANIFASHPIVQLTEVGATIRHFDPTFDLRKYGYARTKGLKGVAEDAVTHGIITMTYDQTTNMYLIRPALHFDAFIERTQAPADFERIRRTRMLMKLILYVKREDLARLLSEATRVLAEHQARGEPLTPAGLLELLCQRLEDEQNRREKWAILFGNVVRSHVLRDHQDQAITELGQVSIATIEPLDVACASYQRMAQREILAQFQEEISLDGIQELLF